MHSEKQTIQNWNWWSPEYKAVVLGFLLFLYFFVVPEDQESGLRTATDSSGLFGKLRIN